ncbi:MAG: glycosyltransferase family 2 protein [Xanthomonadales bacterium]|nr:glycosyltransferase family 2 protein [Xanthomonadales bacterium]
MSPRHDWKRRRCIVVIPAFNEQKDIAAVVREVRRVSGFPIIVVDDCSSDNTRAEAQGAGARVIPLSQQLGAWGALQTGLRYACREGYEFALTMDADGQHEAVWIDKLFAPVIEGDADVSIGCCVRRGSRLRKIAWVMLKAASGLKMEDITSGFRVYNRRAMDLLAGPEATLLEYQDVGVLTLLKNAGLHIEDVDVTMLPRTSGTSRVYHSWLVVAYYMAHTLLLGFSKRDVRRR